MATKLEIIISALACDLPVQLGNHTYVIQDGKLWVEAYVMQNDKLVKSNKLLLANITVDHLIKLANEAPETLINHLHEELVFIDEYEHENTGLK